MKGFLAALFHLLAILGQKGICGSFYRPLIRKIVLARIIWSFRKEKYPKMSESMRKKTEKEEKKRGEKTNKLTFDVRRADLGSKCCLEPWSFVQNSPGTSKVTGLTQPIICWSAASHGTRHTKSKGTPSQLEGVLGREQNREQRLSSVLRSITSQSCLQGQGRRDLMAGSYPIHWCTAVGLWLLCDPSAGSCAATSGQDFSHYLHQSEICRWKKEEKNAQKIFHFCSGNAFSS